MQHNTGTTPLKCNSSPAWKRTKRKKWMLWKGTQNKSRKLEKKANRRAGTALPLPWEPGLCAGDERHELPRVCSWGKGITARDWKSSRCLKISID